MSKRICDVVGCTNPHIAQGKCPKHYRIARLSGEIQKLDTSGQHRMLNHDPDALTGTCSICGPVAIRMVPQKGGTRRAACYPKLHAIRTAKRKREIGTERYNAYHREYGRRHKFNLPKGGVEALVDAAGSRCEICQAFVTAQTASIDHDHACCDGPGQTCGFCIRGILCTACNHGLGQFRDDLVRMRAAVAYLERYGEERLPISA